MPLPPGYSITTAAGLKTLWQDGHCVTVQSADAPDSVLAEIAIRHAARAETTAPPVEQYDDIVNIIEIARRLDLPKRTVTNRLAKARRRRRITPLRRDRRYWYRWRDILTIPGIRDAARPPAHPRTDIDEIVEARRAGHTLQEIGDRHHLTHERVRQILARAAQRFGHPVGRACLGCGTIVTGARGRAGLCADCARRRARKRTCRQCGTQFAVHNGAHTYCPDCQTETRPCAACGQPIVRDRTRQNATFRNRQWFCDRRCFGRWIALTHGFLAHPEHIAAKSTIRRQTPGHAIHDLRPPRVRWLSSRGKGLALILPTTLAARFSTGRVHLTVHDRTLTLTGVRRTDTGPNTRALFRRDARIARCVIAVSVLAWTIDWLRPGARFEIAEVRRHRAVLRVLPAKAPAGADPQDRGAQ
jgi:hypothetical protein